LKHKIPKVLLYSRLVFACITILFLLLKADQLKWIVLLLLYTGLLTDVFDGIIARKLNISTDNFRLSDTIIDLIFYISFLIFITATNPQQITGNIILISGILCLETMMYLVSLARFGKLPSPHAILSKFWGIYLVVEFSLLILGVNGSHFMIALCIGFFVHLDRVSIYVLLREWDHDIPSSYHALLIRNGKSITRNKLFNG